MEIIRDKKPFVLFTEVVSPSRVNILISNDQMVLLPGDYTPFIDGVIMFILVITIACHPFG